MKVLREGATTGTPVLVIATVIFEDSARVVRVVATEGPLAIVQAGGRPSRVESSHRRVDVREPAVIASPEHVGGQSREPPMLLPAYAGKRDATGIARVRSDKEAEPDEGKAPVTTSQSAIEQPPKPPRGARLTVRPPVAVARWLAVFGPQANDAGGRPHAPEEEALIENEGSGAPRARPVACPDEGGRAAEAARPPSPRRRVAPHRDSVELQLLRLHIYIY